MIQFFEDCQLELDTYRGVLYIHNKETGTTILRICRLPKDINLQTDLGQLDITLSNEINQLTYTK